GRQQAGQREPDPPAPGPQVGQQPGDRVPVAGGLRSRAGRRRVEGRASSHVAGGRAKTLFSDEPPNTGEPRMEASTTSLPEGRMPVLRVMPMPADANVHGDVFGGWIMSQVDIAGSLPAVRRANGRVATVAVNSFVFKQPVFVGDLLSFYADVVKVGRTSITVFVEVYAQRNRLV